MNTFQQATVDRFRSLQDRICGALEALDDRRFREDDWAYDAGSGGGRTRVLEGGTVFEKAGVNFSALSGPRLPQAALPLAERPADVPFFATGVSLVVHPRNPHVPTVHMNVRYFAAGADGEHWWFGGGIDLTPYYPRLQDVVHFHNTLKTTCDRFEPGRYEDCKRQCDDYFYLPHRRETRGVGGIFFDRLQRDRDNDRDYVMAVGDAFLPAYLPIVEANRDIAYGEREREFQLVRRGRYVEFNLLFDRGTKFGIDSSGRTESILMSLPAEARWRYDWQPEPGSPEAALLAYLRPRDWLAPDIAEALQAG